LVLNKKKNRPKHTFWVSHNKKIFKNMCFGFNQKKNSPKTHVLGFCDIL